MKKLIICLMSISCICGNMIAADNDDDNDQQESKLTGAAAKAELKKQFKANVNKEENGDVIITGLPTINMANLAQVEDVGAVFFMFLTYVDPDLDLANLKKNIDRAAGNRKTPGGGYLLKDIMKGIEKSLARNNMSLQKVGFGGNNVRLKMNEGLPIMLWIRMNDLYDNEFKDRTEKRASAENTAEWKKTLRKLEQKKLDKSSTTYMRALCIGYNSDTNEYLIDGVSKDPIWLTDKELKDLVWEAYILRF